MFKRNKIAKKEEKCPSEALSGAESIANKYNQLSKCCEILSDVRRKDDDVYGLMYAGGWRVREYQLKSAGINTEEVYKYIKCLAEKKKSELECELRDIEL